MFRNNLVRTGVAMTIQTFVPCGPPGIGAKKVQESSETRFGIFPEESRTETFSGKAGPRT
jgi:hypothetical protein